MYHTAEGLPSLIITLSHHLQGTGVIQTYHTDEAFAVDGLGIVAHGNGKGLNCCQRNELLNLLEGTKRDIKFLHLRTLLLYKIKSLVYNILRHLEDYNKAYANFQYAFLVDIRKKS